MNGCPRGAAMLLFSAALFVATAQQGGGTGQSGMGMQRGTGPGAMGGHMGRMLDSSGMMDSCAMEGMGMMHMMKPHFVLGTQDGGFVVFIGNKIMKYDKYLDMKKEVEIKMDTTAMARWRQHMQNCPMMRRGQGAKGSDTAGSGAQKR